MLVSIGGIVPNVIVQSIYQKAWHNTLKVAQNSLLKDDELKTEKFDVRVIELGVKWHKL